MSDFEISTAPADRDAAELLERFRKEAESAGYHINPDDETALPLMAGLLANKRRYGYFSCPCRLSEGSIDADRDIICPCDYRDADLEEYDACYCALYVSEKITSGGKEAAPIPERRLPAEARVEMAKKKAGGAGASGSGSFSPSDFGGLPYPVWRCRVCGYLCARVEPPQVCPICKAGQDRFERFI